MCKQSATIISIVLLISFIGVLWLHACMETNLCDKIYGFLRIGNVKPANVV